MVTEKTGFLFPGQGAQYVGMGREWHERFDSVRNLYEKADRILGLKLSQICFEGPEETLTRTLYAQPAIFVTSLAILSVLEAKRPELKPDFAAGLSLGEFTALAALRSLSFEEGLKLVEMRALLMEKAASETQGTMISIIGLDRETCTVIARESGLDLANLNAPDQFVLSGPESCMDMAAQRAQEKGAKKIIRLKVGGAFHSRLMESAKQGLRKTLQSISIRPPRASFVANASGQIESDPEKIRTLLGDQLTRPVQWIQTVELARSQGVRRFVELGPGRVLKGLVRRIDSSLEVTSVDKISDLEGAEKKRC